MLSFVIALIVCIIFGLITRSMNKSKGYDGGFAWGFFLNIIGIIVVAVRPYAKQGSQSNSSSTSSSYTSSSNTQDSVIYYCKNCKTVLSGYKYGNADCPDCRGFTVKTTITKPQWDSMSGQEKFMKKAEWFHYTTEDILRNNGLTQYLQLFRDNGLMDLGIAIRLTESDLKEIGVEPLGERKRIIGVFESLK